MYNNFLKCYRNFDLRDSNIFKRKFVGNVLAPVKRLTKKSFQSQCFDCIAKKC